MRWMCLIAICSAVQGAPAAALRGNLVDSESGIGIAAARVQLVLDFSDDLVAESATDAKGRFVFEAIFSGRYRVNAQKVGYLDFLSPSRAVSVAGSDPPPLVVTLTRTAAVSGRVVKASGEPVRDAQVVALSKRFSANGDRLVVEARGAADDRGDYRVYGLGPGRYTVAVLPNGQFDDSEVFAPQYFPGVSQPNRAEFFVLKPGDTRSNTDFVLLPESAAEVHGRVTGVEAGSAGFGTTVSLFLVAGVAPEVQTVRTDADGRFTFRGVAAGAYQVVALSPAMSWGQSGPEPGSRSRYGSLPAEVTGGDLDNIEVSLSDLSTIDGDVTAEPKSGVGSACYAGSKVVLQPLDPMPAVFYSLRGAGISVGGSFTIRGVPSGRYRVDISGLRPPCFVKAVAFGLQEARGGIVTVDKSGRLTLTLSAEVGTVEGKVVSNNVGEVSSAIVILVPLGASSEGLASRVRMVVADAEGHFTLRQLEPGLYRALALRSVASYDYLDPASWRDEAPAIDVKAANSAQIELRILE